MLGRQALDDFVLQPTQLQQPKQLQNLSPMHCLTSLKHKLRMSLKINPENLPNYLLHFVNTMVSFKSGSQPLLIYDLC